MEMMKTYSGINAELVKLVLVCHDDDCKTKPYLFIAPSSAVFDEGAYVMVRTRRGLQPGKVVMSDCVLEGGTEYRMLLAATGAKEPLGKVIGQMKMLKWEEECNG